MAIIIDDMGNNLEKGKAALSLPGDVTYAVLPHSPYGEYLAEMGHRLEKQIMLHAPMENTQHRNLGPGGLTKELSEEMFIEILRDDIKAVPFVVGVNNHMGSLLTQLEPQMTWLMAELKRQGLYFVDSVTTADTVAWRVAEAAGIPNLRRQVFLDHEVTTQFIDHQFLDALRIANSYGEVVVIGHPYPETISYLQAAIPTLKESGVELVFPTRLLEDQSKHPHSEPQISACDHYEGHCGD